MGKSLIIVESPAKIKTLSKILGPKYIFESSIGHIRDLPQKEFGIDVENNFTPTYVTMPDKLKVVASLQKAAKGCDTVYLCPDPDREGEAIAWHIKEILPTNTVTKRVSFNSITKDAVLKALEHPREIDQSLVDAQQARRLLDRMVGYKISPILNRRIQRGKGESVSAGRVQSVALKFVVEREKEIMAFLPMEYWNLAALLKGHKEERQFRASLYSVDGRKVDKEPVEGKNLFIINNKEIADQVITQMKLGSYRVEHVEKKEKRRFAVPPFITSTLQQEASRHHGFSSNRTMSVAQKLYEGIEIGDQGAEGLITYMRTDSVRVAPEAISDVRNYIQTTYGPDFLPDSPKFYTTKKSAQDAHEAIRPANLKYTPESIQKYLTKEEFLLYQLIWRRFIASQMMPAVYDTLSADITNDNGIIVRATGSVIKFQGFLAVYEEKFDDDDESDENKQLPPLEEGDALKLMDLTADQAFTRPPPRYTEASLVKELEKSGIGRPSTYAAIMNKIQSRDYTVKESARLKPTELGFVIAALLEANFTQIMDINFTASMEDSLEMVADNKKNWKELLSEFWGPFIANLAIAEKEAFVPRVATEIECPSCKKGTLQKVWFKNKYFYGCSNYPECSHTAPLEELTFNKEEYAEDFNWEQACPECQSPMKLRHGRFGAFLGCTKYPECRGIVNIPKRGEVFIPLSEMPACPAIGCTGRLQSRKSRFGKTFYSCSTYPECDVIVNNLEDVATKYPNHPRTAYEKKTKGGKKGAPAKKGAAAKTATKKKAATTKKKTPSTRVQPKMKLSDDLAEFLGTAELSRGDVTKQVWVYIKENNLQDEKDKRMIVPDSKLAKVFGSPEPINMFKMTSVISKHLG